MNRTFSETKLEAMLSGRRAAGTPRAFSRRPSQITRVGIDRFDSFTLQRIREATLRSIDTYAPDFAGFARAMWLRGAETLPRYDDLTQELEFELIEDPESVKEKNYAAWFAWTIYQRTIEKLQREPVEELQIDLTAGTKHQIERASASFSERLARGTPPFISLLVPAADERSTSILEMFLVGLIESSSGKLPGNFSVNPVKVANIDDVAAIASFLSRIEVRHSLDAGSIKIGLTAALPETIVDSRGKIILNELTEAAGGRCASFHLDINGFLGALGIPAVHRHPRHEACNFARQIMYLALSPAGTRLSDSFVPASNSSEDGSMHRAWREHFNAVSHSLIGGFYQGVDPEPALIPARYAAIYSFFLEAKDTEGRNLRESLTQAVLAGAEPDASAVNSLNFFYRSLDCGALTRDDVRKVTGLTAVELECRSFEEIVKSRRYKTAAG